MKVIRLGLILISIQIDENSGAMRSYVLKHVSYRAPNFKHFSAYAPGKETATIDRRVDEGRRWRNRPLCISQWRNEVVVLKHVSQFIKSTDKEN